jgi:hypothetical protein
LQYVTTPQTFKGNANTFAGLCHFNALLDHIGHFAAEIGDGACGLGHQVTAKDGERTLHLAAYTAQESTASFSIKFGSDVV